MQILLVVLINAKAACEDRLPYYKHYPRERSVRRSLIPALARET
jgi:hypothetical protein